MHKAQNNNPEFHVFTEEEHEFIPNVLTQKDDGRPVLVVPHASYGHVEDGDRMHLAAVIEHRAAPMVLRGIGSVPYFVAFTYPECGHVECVEYFDFCMN